jgi:hypothetical protein
MDDRERQLDVEGAERRRVALLAIAGGTLFLFGQLIVILTNAKEPAIGVLQGLAPALHGAKQALTDPRIGQARFIDKHAVEEILGWVVAAVGLVCMIWPLLFLRGATVARGGKPSRVTRVLAVAAPLLCGLAAVGSTVTETIDAHKFVTQADHTTSAYNSLNFAAFPAAFLILEYLGFFSLAVLFVLIALRAMRVGLLTRAMGIIGIFAGIVFVIQLVPLPVLQFLWLVGLGMMLLELAGLKMPPAWAAGEAIPWVSAAQQRAASRAASSRGPRGAQPVLAPAPAPPEPSHSASKKRKRRRS